MKDTTAAFAVHAIGDRIGVAIRAQLDVDANSCQFTPVDLHPNEGFSVELRLGWRSAEAALIPGRFSGPMIARMGSSGSEEREVFATFVKAVLANKTKVLMRVNGSEVAPLEWEAWPSNWSQIELSLKLTPFVVEVENEAQHERLILDLVVPMFGMVVALLGAEENELPTTGEIEGRAFERIVT